MAGTPTGTNRIRQGTLNNSPQVRRSFFAQPNNPQPTIAPSPAGTVAGAGVINVKSASAVTGATFHGNHGNGEGAHPVVMRNGSQKDT